MLFHYIVRTDNGTNLLATERKPLDSLAAQQWQNAQFAQVIAGDLISLLTVAIYGTFANDAARNTAANYAGPNGSIWYQTDTKQYYKTTAGDNTAPTAYTFPAQTAAAAGGGSSGSTATAKAKRYVNAGYPASSQTGLDGTIWAVALDNQTYTGTQAPSRGPANGPTQSDYDTWRAAQTAPYPSFVNFSYWVQPSSSTDDITYTLKGFTANATVKVTLYCYTRAADYYGSSWTFPVRFNGTLQTATVGASGFWTQTFTATADSTGVLAIKAGGTERVTAGYRFTAIKAEEQ